MDIKRTVEKARAGTAGTVFFGRGHRRLNHLGMTGQAEVVIGADHDSPFALDGNLRTGGGFDDPEIRVQSLGHYLACGRIIEAFFEQVGYLTCR